MEYAQRAKDLFKNLRDNSQWCWRWTFFFSNMVLLCLTIAFLITGAAVTQLKIFHRSMKWIWRDYLINVVFFTLFYLGMIGFGLCILGKRFQKNNCAIIGYASTMFLVGFIAMAAQSGALAFMESIDILKEEHLIENAYNQGVYFRETLNSLIDDFKIKEVRGRGLLNAVEFYENNVADRFSKLLLKKGIIAKTTHDNIIRFSPPLIINRKEIDKSLTIIKNTLDEL